MARRSREERRQLVAYLQGMNLGELSAYCSGVLSAHGLVPEGEFQRPKRKLRVVRPLVLCPHCDVPILDRRRRECGNGHRWRLVEQVA